MTLHRANFDRFDKATYSARMARAMSSKLFFLNDLGPGTTVLDYGCGPGDLAKAAISLRPDLKFVGYDADPDMIREANRSRNDRASFFDDESEAVGFAASASGPTAVLFSSVLHEIATFGGVGEVARCLRICDKFDDVIIRDMAADPTETDIADDASDLRVSKDMLASFSERWGRPDNAISVAHLMLKARYPDNWDAENGEDYFAASSSGIRTVIMLSHPLEISFMRGTPEFLLRDLYARHGRFPKIRTHMTLHARKAEVEK